MIKTNTSGSVYQLIKEQSKPAWAGDFDLGNSRIKVLAGGGGG